LSKKLSLFKTRRIISVSRRNDIPAFFGDWLLKVLHDGYVDVPNPFNRKVERIGLGPDDVLGFVFWSRYPISLLKALDFIDNNYNRNHYLNLTINDYPKVLEPKSPQLSKVFFLVEFLYDRYGENYIQWRFDPIIISNLTPKNYILDKFAQLCFKLSGKVRTCITSFVDFYPKVKRRFERNNNIKFFNPEMGEKAEIITAMERIANEHKIQLRLCCESELAQKLDIESASCVNPLRFHYADVQNIKIKPTRSGCTCYESKDIGMYNTCLFDCLYCYANFSYDNSLKNYLFIKKNFANQINTF